MVTVIPAISVEQSSTYSQRANEGDPCPTNREGVGHQGECTGIELVCVCVCVCCRDIVYTHCLYKQGELEYCLFYSMLESHETFSLIIISIFSDLFKL